MKAIITRLFLSASFLLLLISTANSQADLILTSLDITPTNANKGEVVTVTMTVKNNGSTACGASLTRIILVPTDTSIAPVHLGYISLEPLAAGASTSIIEFKRPLPYNVSQAVNEVYVTVDFENVITESNEQNTFASQTTITTNTNVTGGQNLPYPLIYVHGLASDNNVWNTLLGTFQSYFGWSYGGSMNFCLNMDGNTSTTNVSNDYQDWTGNLQTADFYTVNFNVNQNGFPIANLSNSLESNQSAVLKQGYAIRDAVKHVMDATGKDKVILVGHSMGGLASREYLQNDYIWQTDAQHHVAKLLTVGTPHGGSNSTSFGLGLGGINERSEAVRDLRWQYQISGDSGVFLFGGTESDQVMNNGAWNYVNVDVNCNGVTGESIIGLNSKGIPNDLGYACIIGTGDILGGDGVVSEQSANLKYYKSYLNVDTFMLDEPSSNPHPTWHQGLPEEVPSNVLGIDEPGDSYDLSYNVTSNQLYFGIIQQQSLGNSFVRDYDPFRINTAGGNLNIKVYDIPISTFRVDVVNSSLTNVFTANSNGKSYLNLNTNIPAGDYYVEFSGMPTYFSWFCQYGFKLTYTPGINTSIRDVTDNNYFNTFNYPNPFSNKTTISFTLPESSDVSIKVFNLFGELISDLAEGQRNEGQHYIDFDASNLASGIYVYTIQSGQHIESHKLVIEK